MQRTRVHTTVVALLILGLSGVVGPSSANAQWPQPGSPAWMPPVPEPVLTGFLSPATAVIDFYAIMHYLVLSSLVDAINAETDQAHQIAAVNSLLVNARRYMEAGMNRIEALISPTPVGEEHRFGEPWGTCPPNNPACSREERTTGKLQRDLEVWEEKYPEFDNYNSAMCGRPSIPGLTLAQKTVLCDHYFYVKEEMVRKWTARIRPCWNHMMSEWELVRRTINTEDTVVEPMVAARTLHDRLFRELPATGTLRVGEYYLDRSEFDWMDQLVSTVSRMRPNEVLAACQEQGPVAIMSILATALEHEAWTASVNGKSTDTEIRVVVESSNAERMSFEVRVKGKDETIDDLERRPGVLIHPADIKNEDQIEPYGMRPDGNAGSAWFSASPGDEIWIRAMVNGKRRDFIKYEVIGRRLMNPGAPAGQERFGPSQIRVMPSSLPRNYYMLEYRTHPPNPLYSYWKVKDESYQWSGQDGPWDQVGGARVETGTARLRDWLFGSTAVNNDMVKFTVPERNEVQRLSELSIAVSGTANWTREGPRLIASAQRQYHDESESGEGEVKIRIEYW